MCQIPAMTSPLSAPSPPPPSPKFLNTQAQPSTHAPSSPQPSQKILNPQVQTLTRRPKLLNPHAQPFKPPSSSETKPSSPPKAIFPAHELFRQQQDYQYALATVITSRFAYQSMYYYQPRSVWSSLESKVEYCNAFQQPLMGNLAPYHGSSGVNEDYGEEEVVTEENVEKLGVANSGKKKMDECQKSFVHPKWRPQRNNIMCNRIKKWALKKSVYRKKDGEGGRNTTLMIKNIPNQLERHDLLRILDDHCREENLKAKLHSDPFRSEYDFVYLPMDFGFRANLGYAFVNFTTAVGATRFRQAYREYEWDAQVPGSKKICQVSHAAIQGKNALTCHFELSKFRCHTDDYLPAILTPPRDGWKNTSPIIVGKRINIVPAAAVHRRKQILMMRNHKQQRHR